MTVLHSLNYQEHRQRQPVSPRAAVIQVTHLHQHTVQRSLIDIDNGKAVKPFVPLLAELSLDANKVLFLCHVRIVLFIIRTAFS